MFNLSFSLLRGQLSAISLSAVALVVSPLSALAATPPKATTSANRCGVAFTFGTVRENSRELNECISELKKQGSTIAEVIVVGRTTPQGPARVNKRLARERSQLLASRIGKALPGVTITRIEVGPTPKEGLVSLVQVREKIAATTPAPAPVVGEVPPSEPAPAPVVSEPVVTEPEPIVAAPQSLTTEPSRSAFINRKPLMGENLNVGGSSDGGEGGRRSGAFSLLGGTSGRSERSGNTRDWLYSE